MENMQNENRNNLLKKIMEYKFFINDMTLYLDTHQNDMQALKLHNENVKKLDKVTKEYEENYGPLTIETVMESWDWVQDLWPWQRGFNR